MTFLCLFRLFLLSRHQKRTAQKTSRNVQRQKPVETVSPKSQSKRSAPKARRHDQPQKPIDTISPKSQATRSAPKARFWVPKAEFSQEENQGSVRYLREHLGIRSPAWFATCESIWASELHFARVPTTSFFGVILPIEGPILEGPRGQKAREK